MLPSALLAAFLSKGPTVLLRDDIQGADCTDAGAFAICIVNASLACSTADAACVMALLAAVVTPTVIL